MNFVVRYSEMLYIPTPFLTSYSHISRLDIYAVMPSDSCSGVSDGDNTKSATNHLLSLVVADASVRRKNDRYYFEDGTAIFWVEGLEFCVHRYFFTRDSQKIGKLLKQSQGAPVLLENTSVTDFERFLSILYPTNFDQQANYTTPEWVSILTFASTWGFNSIRRLAIEKIDKIGTAVEKIAYGKQFGVPSLLEDAYVEVCAQPAPLTQEDGKRLGIEDVLKIASTRERFLKQPKYSKEARQRIIRDIFRLSTREPTERSETGDSEQNSLANLPRTLDSPLDVKLLLTNALCRQPDAIGLANSDSDSDSDLDDESNALIASNTHFLPFSMNSIEEYILIKQTLDGSNHSSDKARSSYDTKIVDEVEGLLKILKQSSKFNLISDQIIASTNKCQGENNGHTLIQITRLIVEKGTNDGFWPDMYTRLCRKMALQISPQVQGEGTRDADGKPVAGGQLFYIRLLQTVMYRLDIKYSTSSYWNVRHPQEYLAQKKVQRQGWGLAKMIGELFKASILPEWFIHRCAEKMLDDARNSDNDDITRLYNMLEIAGPYLDTSKAHDQMDSFFSHIRNIADSNDDCGFEFHARVKLCNLLDLRDRKWDH